MLGPRTPDLTLVALRLVLAGRRADDASVVQLRGYAEGARAGGADAAAAREAYQRMLALIVFAILLAFAPSASASAQTATPIPNLYRFSRPGPSSRPAREIHGTIESVDYPGERSSCVMVHDLRSWPSFRQRPSISTGNTRPSPICIAGSMPIFRSMTSAVDSSRRRFAFERARARERRHHHGLQWNAPGPE